MVGAVPLIAILRAKPREFDEFLQDRVVLKRWGLFLAAILR